MEFTTMEITEGIANFARSEGIEAIPIMFSVVLACTVSEDIFSAIRFTIRDTCLDSVGNKKLSSIPPLSKYTG